jgi:hypothetical protein
MRSVSLWLSCAATLLSIEGGRLVNRIDDAVAAPLRPAASALSVGTPAAYRGCGKGRQGLLFPIIAAFRAQGRLSQLSAVIFGQD